MFLKLSTSITGDAVLDYKGWRGAEGDGQMGVEERAGFQIPINKNLNGIKAINKGFKRTFWPSVFLPTFGFPPNAWELRVTIYTEN